jgi:mono/diheme cytochrome c family protein
MFSLDGSIEPVASAGRAGSGPVAAIPRAAGPADVDNGARIYREACLPCHGMDGGGGEGGGAALTAGLTLEAVIAVTVSGRGNMPAFAASYSPEELRDVAQYIVEVLGENGD